MRRLIVGAMGAGEGASARDVANAQRLGELLAREGFIVLTGGRDAGVMRAVTHGAKQVAGSLTIGIMPSVSSSVAPDVDVAIVTDMHNARNNINVLSCTVVVACGCGGAGTVSEIALALKAGKPVVLLAHDELSRTFFERLGGKMVSAVETPEEVVPAIRRFVR